MQCTILFTGNLTEIVHAHEQAGGMSLTRRRPLTHLTAMTVVCLPIFGIAAQTPIRAWIRFHHQRLSESGVHTSRGPGPVYKLDAARLVLNIIRGLCNSGGHGVWPREPCAGVGHEDG
jgi:hypothetical protein